MKDEEIHYLIELLDDDNEQSASLAMAALLKRDSASIDQCLCSLQESDNPRLRRRVHQLESALSARRKRGRFQAGLKRTASSLLDGCIQLHLAWYDNDLKENVMKQWNELISGLKNKGGRRITLRTVAEYLANDFQCPLNDDVNADFYCFGVVIDDHCGSDLLLSIVSLELLRACGRNGRILRAGDDFGVQDTDGSLLFPGKGWAYAPHSPFGSSVPEGSVALDDIEVLRYISSMLFLCAVSCDSFRYIYTISQAMNTLLTGSAGVPDLPYPYTLQTPGGNTGDGK